MNAPWKLRGGATASVGGITAIEFDPEVELLWVCDTLGTLTSFTVQPHAESPVWSTYSSFSATTRAVNGIFFLNINKEKMVVVADREMIRGFKRGGVPVMCLSLPAESQNYIDLFQANNKTGCMYFTGNVGLTRLQVNNGESSHITIPTDDVNIVALKQSEQWVATGNATGTIVCRDAKDLHTIGQVTPSRQRVLAMDVFDNTILAAFSERSATSFVKVYDVRKLTDAVSTISNIRSGNIIQMRRYQDSFGLSRDRAFLLTPQGFHIIQLDQEQPVFSSSPISDGACTSVAVSPSGMCAAIGNDKGYFFALAHPLTREEYVMSTFVQPTRPKQPTFAQSWLEENVATGFDESTPTSRLASSWPDENYMILTIPQKLRCINVESNSIVHNQWGLIRADSYLPDPKDVLSSVLPNPYPFNDQLGSDPTRAQQLLLQLRKEMKPKDKTSRSGGSGEYSVMEDALQVCYSMQRKLDWKSYNEIAHKVVGFDNSYPECWITPLLQSLYLCQPPEFPIRRVIIRHVCSQEYCMTCEIAFIFSNMLTIATSALGLKEALLPPIAQVGNLIRTMLQLRPFVESGVFVEPKSRDDAVAKMHLAQRLILETLHRDLQNQKLYPLLNYQPPVPEYENSIAALFGTEFTSNGRVHVEPRFFWEVPASALKVDEGLQHLLKQLEVYKDHVQIKRLPPIIVLLLNPEHGNLKPPTSLKISRAGKEDYNYVLNSNIIHLADDIEDHGNFVSHQRIKDDNFALVNDYRITLSMKVQQLERLIPALRSHSAVVTFYALDNLCAPSYARNDDNRPLNMWHTLGPLLIHDVLAQPLQRNPAMQHFECPLQSYTEIKAGDLIAIDAEYVVLRWRSRDPESDELFPYQRKPHMALARVSCILSNEDGDERTIVDDYVHTPEYIEDYVTQYSGIHPGDLDPEQSKRNLTSLKATYLKLRALVDAGVIFVGHGLSQDFRVCNVAVPRKQIIDTLEIYHKAGARYLSLRFLAYHVLGENVQENEHDSIEDARTSLRLYRKYVQLQKDGLFESVLDHLMAKGAETSWYVPDNRVTFGETPMTPPASMMGSPVFRLSEREKATAMSTSVNDETFIEDNAEYERNEYGANKEQLDLHVKELHSSINMSDDTNINNTPIQALLPVATENALHLHNLVNASSSCEEKYGVDDEAANCQVNERDGKNVINGTDINKVNNDENNTYDSRDGGDGVATSNINNSSSNKEKNEVVTDDITLDETNIRITGKDEVIAASTSLTLNTVIVNKMMNEDFQEEEEEEEEEEQEDKRRSTKKEVEQELEEEEEEVKDKKKRNIHAAAAVATSTDEVSDCEDVIVAAATPSFTDGKQELKNDNGVKVNETVTAKIAEGKNASSMVYKI